MKNFKRNGLLIAEAIFLLALFLFALFLEAAFSVSVFWQFYAVIAFFSLFITLPSFLSPQRRQTWWLFLTFNVNLFALHFVALSPVKPFMQFQRDISNGMTIQQVQRLFIQRFPENGRFRQPEWKMGGISPLTQPQFVGTADQSLNYTLDPTDGRYNAEFLLVYFNDGKVVATQYFGD